MKTFRLAVVVLAVAVALTAPRVPAQTGPRLADYFTRIPQTVLEAGYLPRNIFPIGSTGDINGDGHQDLIVLGAWYPLGGATCCTPQPGRVFLGDGDGRFSTAPANLFPVDTLLTVHTRKVLFADFNADGRQDMFISTHGWDATPFPGEQNRLYLSRPDGGWRDATANLPQVSDYSHTSAAGDISGRGLIDIFVGNGYGRIGPYFLLNTGSGQFTQTRTNIPVGNNQLLDTFTSHRFLGATLTDLNGDGLAELVVTADSSSQFDQLRRSTILWNRAGVFTEADTTPLPLPTVFRDTHIDLDVQRIDANQDGLPDLVLVGSQGEPFGNGWFVQILINKGNRQFVDETALRVPPGEASAGLPGLATNAPEPEWVRVLDFNHDGAPDFIVDFLPRGSWSLEQPIIWLNDGAGRFSTLKAGDFVTAGNEFLVLSAPYLTATRNGYSFFSLGRSSAGLQITGLLATKPIPGADNDRDGLPDVWETKFGIDPTSATGENGASGDPDGDGVTSAAEFTRGTDPRIPNVQNFSEGATGFFSERLAVVNPGIDPAEFKIDFLTEGAPTAGGAAVVTQTYSLAAQSRMTIIVNSIPGLANTAVSAILTITKGGVVAERLMMWNAQDGSSYGGHLGMVIPNARTSWFLAEGDAGFFDTYILFSNGNGVAANVTATYLLDSGSTVVRNYVVPSNERLTVFANDVPGLKARAFSTAITSSQPITVERSQYFGSTPSRLWNGGHEAAAIAAPATSWFVAEGRTGPFFSMYLLLANPGATQANVTIRYFKPDGSVVTRNHVLAPTTRTTIEVDSLPGLEDTEVSASITSDQPIAVERAMYWPDPFTSWYEAHDSAGVTATGTRWVFAEGEIGGSLGFETYILLANPTSLNATVNLTFLRTSGEPITIARTVPPNGRLTVSAGEANLTPGERFGVLVDSTNGVPIVSEHAIYWNGGGQFFGGGGNETGLRIRGA